MPTVGDALHLATDCLLILDPLRQGHHGAQSGLPPPSVTAPTVMLLEVFRSQEGVDLIREAVKVAWRLAR